MRIRTIKPQFFMNDELASLPAMTRLLFIGLWGLADREGRLEDRPARIKAEVLPYDEIDVEAALTSLEAKKFIVRYVVNGDALIQVASFSKHQRITGKEAETPSQFPAPDELAKSKKRATRGKQRGNTLGNNGETPETTGREGKGKEGIDHSLAREGRLPSSHSEAIQFAGPQMIPEDFIRATFDRCMAVGFIDTQKRPIASWPHYLAKSWHDEQARAKAGTGRGSKDGPVPWQRNQHVVVEKREDF